MSYHGDVVESRRGDGEISFEWRIPDFLSLAGKAGDHYLSPYFSAFGGKWYFRIFPKGLWQDSQSNLVSLYLYRMDEGLPKTLDLTLGIRGPEGVENKRERRQEFSYDDSGCFWYEFCHRSNLRLMPENVLILSLDMKMDAPRVSRGCEKLSEDISKLLASGEDSDVTVRVGDVEFKVHRNILSARSPVLAAMFRHETEERATNSIKIDDCQPDVFREYLHYLYTGSVHSLTQQTVFDLYRIADKYLAEELEQMCLDHIKVTLCVETFCDTVRLALTHGEDDLLQLAIDFAAKHIPTIIRSVEWQNFIEDFPREANEILIKCIKL